MKKLLKSIKSQAYKDNYANKNYEIAVTFLKTCELLLKDKLSGEDNYYEMYMCPKKTPQIDSYIICTTQKNNDYGLQIKSGSHYDPFTKDIMWNCRHKYALNPKNYLLITWQKFKTNKSFSYQPNILDESILDICTTLEGYKKDFPSEATFIYQRLNEILEASKDMKEANWIILNREMADLFNKNELETFLP